jgi:hypothetical protein
MKQHYAGRFIREYCEITWALQGKMCAICGAGLKLADAKADHCHDTGMPRSALCNGCNTFEGAYGKAYRGGGDTVKVIRDHDARALGRMARRPRGWVTYSERAQTLEKRYWPMWDLFAEQAAELLEAFEQAAHGKRPDGLLALCVSMVMMRWRGMVPWSEIGVMVWQKAKDADAALLPCGRSVQPDVARMRRVLAGLAEKVGLAELGDSLLAQGRAQVRGGPGALKPIREVGGAMRAAA